MVFPFILFSQNCDCESNFNWVKKTFEENDAGFAYAISNKGEQAYQSHNEDFIQRIKEAENSKECLQSIKEWLTFFRSGHISLRMLGQNSEAKIDDKKIIQQYKDTESVAVDIEKFTQYLNSKKEVDYEGIWVSKPYRIGVKKIKDEYVGFIIEADGVYWTKGQVKFKIKPDNSCVYYM